MRTAFNRDRAQRKPTINITPLIDVMFLLLIFFMVSSTFKENLGIQVALPKVRTASEREISLREIVVDRAGQFFFNGEPVADAELRRRLAELLLQDPTASLVLRADREASFGRVLRAIDITREVGGSQLVIPTDLLPVLPEEP